MNTMVKILFSAVLLCLPAIIPGPTWAAAGDVNDASSISPGPQTGTKNTGLPVVRRFGMPFIENKGQEDARVRFYARTLGGTVFVTRDREIVYSLPGPAKGQPGWSLKEELVGARGTALHARNRSVGSANYFIGREPAQWRKEIPSFESLAFGEVYDGISLTLKAYGDNIEKLLHVAPGADPSLIRLRLSGGTSLRVNAQGQLVVGTPHGDVTFTRPVAFQLQDKEKVPVEVAYVIKDNEYGFRTGAYDKTKELVIDPLLQSTYLGGTGGEQSCTEYPCYSYRMALYNGHVYMAGVTFSSPFPGIDGNSAVQGTYGGFVSKFDATLTTLLQSTFVGGASGAHIFAIGVNADGVYVAGDTMSPDLPGVTGGAQATYLNDDAFVMRLNHDLTAVLQSTYLGGSGADRALALAFGTDAVYVGGSTASTDFQGTAGGAQPAHAGGSRDGFVAALNSDLTTLHQATYIGANGDTGSSTGSADYVYGLAVDNGGVFAAGTTDCYGMDTSLCTDLPGTTGGAQPIRAGLSDGFVTKFNPDLKAIIRTTYVGGSYSDSVKCIALGGGAVYVAGHAASYDIPQRIGGAQPANVNDNDAFISKLTTDLTAFIQSTYLGGNGGEGIEDIALEGTSGEVYVTGYTGSANFPGTSGGSQPAKDATSEDAFVSRLNSGLTSIIQSTYLGGSGREYAFGIALTHDSVYLSGYTQSGNLPGSAGGAQPLYGGNQDAFVARLDQSLAAGGDTTPTPFTFTDQTGVPFNALRESNAITVLGISEPSPVSITDGEYAVSADGGATWTGYSATVPATVAFRNMVKVRRTAAGSCSVKTDAVLTIGGVSDTFSITTMPCADVAVSLTAAPDPVINGSDLTYTATITNSGPGEALAVVVTDTLPAGTTFVSAVATQGTCGRTDFVVTCTLGSIAASGTVTVTLVAAAPKAGGLLFNSATVTSGSYDANVANNSDSAETTVLVTSGDIRISGVGFPDVVYTGMQYAYVIAVSNSGPDIATGVVLTDTLPAPAAFVSANATQGSCTQTTGTVTCSLGSLAKGATVTVTLTVSAPATPATLTNTAVTTSRNIDPKSSNNSSIAVTDVIAAPAAGGTIALPRTGQTTSIAAGDDGALRAGVAWPDPRFTNPDNTTPITGELVKDRLTGLTWTRNPLTPGPAECTPDVARTWDEALLYIDCLNDHGFLGQTGWRMPNILEFESLINAETTNLMSWLNGQGFQSFYAGMFWSSTSLLETPPAQVWYGDLYDGRLSSSPKDPLTTTMQTWPVRGSSNGPASLRETGQTACYSSAGNELPSCAATGQDGELRAGAAWPVPRFTGGTGTQADCLTDNLTGLMWPKSAGASWMYWSDALSYANALTLCGYDDWRLPNRTELISLVNFGEASLSAWLLAPAQGFSGLTDSYYWTSTTARSYSADFAWAMYLANGATYPYYKTNIGFVLPVRDAFGGAEVQLTVHAAPDPVLARASLVYTLIVSNAGPADAIGVVVTDTLPPSVTLSSAAATRGTCSWTGNTVTCNIGYLPEGQTATITIAVITASESGFITNTATVTSMVHDPGSGNNTVTTGTTVGAGSHTLVVSREGTGTGTVTGPGISCGTDCTGTVVEGARVTLTAAAGANSRFDGWSAGGCPGTQPCEVLVAGNITVTAVFNSTAGAVDLAETGQTTSYGAYDDGALRAGVAWPDPRFVITFCDLNGPCADQGADCDADTRNDTITDRLTGLMWARDGDPFNLPCSFNVCGTGWDSSMSYYITYSINQGNEPRYANGLCGHKDWRLPNINEMLSLTNLEQPNLATWLSNPAQGFTNIKSYYWSSTTWSRNQHSAWRFNGNFANTDNLKTNEYFKSHFLPVRNAPVRPLSAVPKTGQTVSYYDQPDDGALRVGVAPPSPRFTTIYCNAGGPCPGQSADCDGNPSTDVVRDNLTGLIWARDTDLPGTEAGLLWQSALNFTDTLSLCGFTDWRLPNRSEFLSMTDYSQTTLYLPSGHPFVGDIMNNYLFWTSNTDADPAYHYQAWVVFFRADLGPNTGFNSKTSDARWIWPVRGPVDTSPPTAIFSVNAGAPVTTTATVTLSLAAYDSSGVTEMCLSNSPANCTSWQPFSTTVASWQLSPGDGTKYVYVWLKDGRGNVTPPAAPLLDAIVLDTNAPLGGTLLATEGDAQIGLDWLGFSDGAGSGISFYKVVYSTTAAPPTCADDTLLYVGSAESFVHAGLDNGTRYYYRVCGVDAAGFVSAGVTADGIPGALPARIGGDTYETVQEALDAAGNGDVIQLRAGNFSGSLTFNNPGVTVTLRGGFDAAYSGNSSYTYFSGTLTLLRGTVILDRIVIW